MLKIFILVIIFIIIKYIIKKYNYTQENYAKIPSGSWKKSCKHIKVNKNGDACSITTKCKKNNGDWQFVNAYFSDCNNIKLKNNNAKLSIE